MNNIKITFRIIELPEKVIKKSEAIRHEKLKIYLQNIVEIRDIGKVYAVNSFFNINENEENNSDISSIENQERSGKTRYGPSDVLQNIELQRTSTFMKELSHSSRFSKIIDDLGN